MLVIVGLACAVFAFPLRYGSMNALKLEYESS